MAGTRVTVPLAAGRLPAPGRLRALVSQLVRLRPILEDPTRAVLLEQPGHTPALVTYPAPEPDGDRPVLFDDEVEIGAGVSARITVRRAKEPLSQGFSRATRRGGLVIRSGRAAHETTLAARKAGYGKKRVPEYVPYRMLEVEAAANTVYAWAAEQILARRLPEERPNDPAEYAAAVRQEAQALRHRAHHKLMQAFLEPEIFEGAVSLGRTPVATSPQLRLAGDEESG
ncbi:MAG TPA: hypothetical protein VMU39_08380 [Solirubrobacteraceae bacterium]|nr:hypothetical protein [Solirubrobacteraceae bacterium]